MKRNGAPFLWNGCAVLAEYANAEKFVEGILVISTYGKRFIEDNNDIKKINQLKRLIVDDLLPNYQRMLEAEMGILYLRHMASKKEDKENIVESDSTSG